MLYPSIGPIQGVHPNPNARPIMYGKNIFFDPLASNLFSKFRYGMFITPISWSEKITIIIPAKILNISEFCKNNLPNKEAEAPKIIKTVEKPKQNKINGKIFIFFEFITCWSGWPDTYEMYPGIRGKTQGDKKLRSPAPKEISGSII